MLSFPSGSWSTPLIIRFMGNNRACWPAGPVKIHTNNLTRWYDKTAKTKLTLVPMQYHVRILATWSFLFSFCSHLFNSILFDPSCLTICEMYFQELISSSFVVSANRSLSSYWKRYVKPHFRLLLEQMCPCSRSMFADLTLARAGVTIPDVFIQTLPRQFSSFGVMIIWCTAQIVGVTGMLQKLLVNLEKQKPPMLNCSVWYASRSNLNPLHSP